MNRFDELFDNMLAIDTETNSDDYHTAQIVEVGFVGESDGSWVEYEQLYKPDVPLSALNMSITNITNMMIKDCSDYRTDVAVYDELFSGDVGFVSHNAFFDKKVFENNGTKISDNWVCTLRLTKLLFNDLEKYTLSFLRYHFLAEDHFPEDFMAHRAKNDSVVCLEVFKFLVKEMEKRDLLNTSKKYLPQILEYQKQPLLMKIMPFGKHRGTEMIDVPFSYYSWMLSNLSSLDENSDDYDSDLFESVAYAIEQKTARGDKS